MDKEKTTEPLLEPSPNNVRPACADFVHFCKEQHLRARSAETFIRVLHNQNWEQEVARIREAMRPEVERVFAPVEEALREGCNCQELMAKLVKAVYGND
jgi:hypothetical protein